MHYMGIRLIGDDEPAADETDTSLLPNAYGLAASGDDGGAFIEFRQMPEPESVTSATRRSELVPNFTGFKSSDKMTEFGRYWFDGIGQANNNVIYLLGARKYDNRSKTGYFEGEVCVIFHENHVRYIDGQEIQIPVGETVCHEFGHRYGLVADHVDQSYQFYDHDKSSGAPKINCLMTYLPAKGEFCIECLNYLRSRNDF
jgi:hypothetical protein